MESGTLAGPPAGVIPAEIAEAERDTRRIEAPAVNAAALTMFRFSGYVHVGPGAETCEKEGEGCVDPAHFHAWCRLPNKFQQRDLTDKGMAAKARMLRRLRDPESDAAAVMGSEVALLRASGDLNTMIDDLLRTDWSTDYLKALEEVELLDEFATVDADRERYQELVEIGEALRPEDEQTDEFRELTRHVGRYLAETKKQLAAIQEPKRIALSSLGREGVIEQLREKRIAQLGDNAFAHAHAEWTWFVGTLDVERHPATGRPHRRAWQTVGSIERPEEGAMWSAPPEVIEAVEAAFHALEVSLQRGVAGNS